MSDSNPSATPAIVGQFEDEVGSLVEVRDSAVDGYSVSVDGRVVQDRLTPAGLGAYLCHVLQNNCYKIKKAYSGPSSIAEPKVFPVLPEGLHPETKSLVFRFACALADKLHAAEQKYGYSDGWAGDDWEDECRERLHEHLTKGDPRDVANYCAFMWHHGWSTAPRASVAQPYAWVLESEYERGEITVREREYHDTEQAALIDQERHGGKISPLYMAPPSATAFIKPGSTYLPIAIDLLNRVKAWRDSDGNEGFPHDVRELIDAVLLAYEVRNRE